MNNRKIKVAWICCISNQQIRDNLHFYKWTPIAILRRYFGKIKFYDYAKWNTNAIKEFEKFNDIELHIISPHMYISHLHEFSINDVNYHIINSEDDSIWEIIRTKLLKCSRVSFNRNSKRINNLIEKIDPDIVQMIGIENPNYGESGLLLSNKRPFIINLQTLMNDPNFLNNYPITKKSYDYRSKIEKALIKKADYIGTKIEVFKNIIQEKIKSDARFIDMSLAVGEKISVKDTCKCFDFVYFAADIAKSVDHAIEAFALAKKKHSNITLLVVGGYNNSLMQQLKERMEELKLGDEVKFIGKPNTHDEVIREICKARFALLPLKIDLISSTIRESMANGLPVITTITPMTPDLNIKRKSVLLSKTSDYQEMADNMCLLLENPDLASELIKNAIITTNERYSNEFFMNEWRERYYEILKINHE